MTELKQTISVSEGLALAVSTVVGSGLLGLPGIVLETGGIYAAAGGWLLTCAAIVPLIYIFMRLGLKYPSSAGLAKYAREAVGDWAGHGVSAVLCGTYVWGIPALAAIGGEYVQRLVSTPNWTVPVFGIAILALMTMINIAGVKVANTVNTVSLVALVTLVACIVVMRIGYLGAGLATIPMIFHGQGLLNYRDLWRVSALLFWALIGWENLSFGLEEFKDPEKSIPRVYWLSFLVVALLYLSLAFVSIGAQASGILITGASGIASLVEDTPVGTFLVGVMVLVILANANAWVFSASRLVYSAGRQGILPSYLGRLSAKSIPSASLLSLLLFYTLEIALTSRFDLSISSIILIVSQNFLILYLISILAYWKSEHGWRKWVMTLLGLGACGFLMSGFSWWIVYPLLLLLLGYYGFGRGRKLTVDGGTG